MGRKADQSSGCPGGGLRTPLNGFGTTVASWVTNGVLNRPSEIVVLASGKASGNAFISGHHKTKRKYRRRGAAWVAVAIGVSQRRLAVPSELAGEGGGGLTRPERLIASAGVVQGLIKFPAQTVVQGQVGPDFPAVLRKQVNRIATHIFGLGRSLQERVGQAELVFGEQVLISDCIEGDRVIRPTS